MSDTRKPTAIEIDGRAFTEALGASRELAAALNELRARLRAVDFSLAAKPDSQREAAHVALSAVINYLQRLQLAEEAIPLINLAGALQSLHLGMSAEMLTPPKRKAGKPPEGLDEEVPRAFAVAAVDGYMAAGDSLDQAARRVASALRKFVPGISTGKALSDLRENIRRDPKHVRHAAYSEAKSMLAPLKDIPAAERAAEVDKFISAIREMASKKPS